MADLVKPGVVAAILSDEQPENPVFQVLGTKIIESSATERVRLNVSDGEYSLATTMLATQLNHLVKEKKIDKYAIIKLTKYQVSVLQQSRHILVCLEIEILKTGDEVGQRIGDPVSSTNFVKGSSRPKPSFNGTANKTNGNSTSAYDSPKPTGKMPFAKGTTPNTPGGTPMRVMPIASLTPYQNKWTIKARVTQKGSVREWKNAKGEGKLFSFTVLDESGDIRVTCFKEEVDKFYDMLETGKAYYISNATLKPANKQYNNTTHDYEMTLRRETIINPCEDSEVGDLPKVIYNFVPVSKLSNHISQIVDVIGVVKFADEPVSIMIKSQNRETKRRNLHLVDKSGAEVQMTLWGDEAEKFDTEGSPVVACKGVRVSDFGGCSISTISSTTMMKNPDIPEAFELKQWFESGGCNQETTSVTTTGGGGAYTTNWKTLEDIKEENMGMGDKPDYVTCKCIVTYCKKENVLYKACATERCNKKVIDLQNGSFRCEKCNKESPDFKYRMILNMNISDETDNIWVTCFQEQGEIILGSKADEIGALMEENEAQFEELLKKPNFTSYFFKIRVKMERYNDEERLRSTVVEISPIAHEDFSRKLIADIEKLSSQ
ncbi:replication protein A 70 kDa DNA-binding subunit-like [Styela clava]